MRRITGAVFLSLDDVMQAPGGPSEDYTGGFDEGGWLFRFGDDGIFDTIGSLFAGDYDLLLGRRTYDIFAAYWPYVEGDGAEMGRAFTRAGKHVLTRGYQPLEWENSYRLGGIDDVAALKQSDGPTLTLLFADAASFKARHYAFHVIEAHRARSFSFGHGALPGKLCAHS